MTRMIALLVMAIIALAIMNVILFIKVNKTCENIKVFSKRTIRNQKEVNEKLRYISSKLNEPLEIAKQYYSETEPFVYNNNNNLRNIMERSQEMSA